MNGDRITVQLGMTVAVITLMGTTALLMGTDRVARVRMITAKVAVTINSRPSYGNNRPSYGNDRPSYGNDRSYGGDRPSYGDRPYNRPTRPSNYEDRGKAYSATPAGEGVSGDGVKKRRPRVGDTRVSSPYDNRDNRGGRAPRRDNRDSRPAQNRTAPAAPRVLDDVSTPYGKISKN